MTGEGHAVDPALEQLFERGRIVPRLPDVVRARALARARAASAAGWVPAPAQASPERTPTFPLAMVAVIAFILGAAGTAAGLLGRFGRPEPTVAHGAPRPPAPPPISPALETERPQPEPVTTRRPARHHAGAAESYAAELELLDRARAAYAGRDFQSTLVLVAEHGRRFPSGRLAEEREALRAWSLTSSGLSEPARRAIETFAVRFPHSVLLPRLREAVGATD
jgi:hypothetical protein